MFKEDNVEQAIIEQLQELGYVVTQGSGNVHWVMIEW